MPPFPSSVSLASFFDWVSFPWRNHNAIALPIVTQLSFVASEHITHIPFQWLFMSLRWLLRSLHTFSHRAFIHNRDNIFISKDEDVNRDKDEGEMDANNLD